MERLAARRDRRRLAAKPGDPRSPVQTGRLARFPMLRLEGRFPHAAVSSVVSGTRWRQGGPGRNRQLLAGPCATHSHRCARAMPVVGGKEMDGGKASLAPLSGGWRRRCPSYVLPGCPGGGAMPLIRTTAVMPTATAPTTAKTVCQTGEGMAIWAMPWVTP